MLKAVVVEDEQNLLDLLVYFLKNNEHYEVIGAFHNPETALQEIPQLAPDVIFLDIEMPKMNGIELAARLKSDHYQLIFTTAYEQYALEALKLEASEYLLKPITPESIASISPKILKKDAMLKQFHAPSEKTYSVQCFGSFTVSVATQVIKWPTRKVEELFAYLLVHSGCIINKWRLAEDLWPDKGMNNIYNSVYLLNKTLKEFAVPMSVVNMNEGYKLEIDALVQIDLLDFNAHNLDNLAANETLQLANYVSLRGPLFHDKDYAWVTLYREQYTIKHQKLLDNLLRYYKEQDLIIYEGLVKDYETLYD